MIKAADLSKDDTVIEVGPGFGALTFALAEKAEKVAAFEIEKKLGSYWDEMIKKNKNVEIVWGNVLRKFPISNFQFPINFKVVSNLPYQITSSVIRLFLEAENQPEVMVFMLQKEVAERICARPGDMSVLAVSVRYYADPEIVMYVPRSSFWPEPEVDSAIIKIKNQKGSLHSRKAKIKNKEFDDIFFKVVKAGFANRRKMLFKNLLPLVGKDKTALKKIFSEVGIAESARAQELSVDDWKKLTSLIHRFTSAKGLFVI